MRLSAPVIGARGSAYLEPGHFQVSLGYRYQYSNRHFVGDVEQTTRELDGSQVVNTVHQLDASIVYAVDDRLSLALGVPYLIAERSLPIRDAAMRVIDRNTQHSHGLGDIALTARFWLLPPSRHPNQNISFGIGIKIPTGESNALDTTRTLAPDGHYTTTTGPVDQSIQPGDGGVGVILDLVAFQRVGDGAFYLNGTYLLNPRDTNGTLTGRSRASESVMSVADAYLARVGFAYAIPRLTGLGLSLGGRIEGVPPRDFVGESNGFRRPGFAVSIEPGATFARGNTSVGVYVPVALYRNRQVSLADIQAGGAGGDAAFADWIFLANIAQRF